MWAGQWNEERQSMMRYEGGALGTFIVTDSTYRALVSFLNVGSAGLTR